MTTASKRSDIDYMVPTWEGVGGHPAPERPEHFGPEPAGWEVVDSDDTYYLLKDPDTGHTHWFYSVDLEFDEPEVEADSGPEFAEPEVEADRPETINLAPSWEAITQALLEVYRTTGNPSAQADVKEEFTRMAKLADLYVKENR